jgi:hypothetical protein
MKRRVFKSILYVPYGCGWTAICEENKAWHLAPKATEWTQLPELPPIEVSSEPVAYQGLGRQDLPIRDWSNLAAKVDRAERVLLNSITNTSINVGCVLRSLISEIRDELGLPKPSEAAK